jgi:hypothetical protein
MTIPYVGRLTDPVVLEPVSAPNIGDKFQMRFKDVGADNYKVYINICHPYANNGINPCLKGIELELARENGRFAVSYPGYVVAPNIGLTIESKNGAIENRNPNLLLLNQVGHLILPKTIPAYVTLSLPMPRA